MWSRCWYYLGSKANVTDDISITVPSCLPTIKLERLTGGIPGEYLKMGTIRPCNAEVRIWTRPVYFEFLVNTLRMGRGFPPGTSVFSSLSALFCPCSMLTFHLSTNDSKQHKKHQRGRNRGQHSFVWCRGALSFGAESFVCQFVIQNFKH